MSDESKSIRVIPFSGKSSDWEYWDGKYMIKAEVTGYAKLIECAQNKKGVDQVPTATQVAEALAKDEEKRTTTDNNIIELHALAKKGMMELMLSMDTSKIQGKLAYKLIKRTKSKDYPDGNIKLAYERLKGKYAPKTIQTLLNLKKKFENSSLSTEENDFMSPDDWIAELEGIRMEMEDCDSEATMTDKDFMVHILNNLPLGYDAILDGLEKDLEQKNLTIDQLREKLMSRWYRMKKNIKAKNDIESREEIGAVAHDEVANYAKQFKGTCNGCGKYGHKKADCPNLTSRQQKLVCWYCDKEGHHIRNCEEFKDLKKDRSSRGVASLAIDCLDADFAF